MTLVVIIGVPALLSALVGYTYHLGYEAGHDHGREYERAAREIGRAR